MIIIHYFIADFTTSSELNPLPWTTFPTAASTPKRSVILMIPFNWPVVHPSENLVVGWMISFPGSNTSKVSPIRRPDSLPALM